MNNIIFPFCSIKWKSGFEGEKMILELYFFFLVDYPFKAQIGLLQNSKVF